MKQHFNVRRASMHGGFVTVLFLAYCRKEIDEWFEVAKTSPNRSVYASLPSVARPPQWLGHSATLHSHVIAPAHFVRPANATHLLIRAAKTS
jgi:hypothetical protein